MNLEEGPIIATSSRVAKLKACLATLHALSFPSARELAQLVGYILSMSVALGPVCRLRTRAFYGIIMSQNSWSARAPWSDRAPQYLELWCSAFNDWLGQPFWKNTPEVSVLTWSDASDSGWGDFSVAGSTHAIALGEWEVKIWRSR